MSDEAICPYCDNWADPESDYGCTCRSCIGCGESPEYLCMCSAEER